MDDAGIMHPPTKHAIFQHKLSEKVSFSQFAEAKQRSGKKDIIGAGTVISRKTMSDRAKWLQKKFLLKEHIFDYGSGRNFNADALKADRFKPTGIRFDPKKNSTRSCIIKF